MPKDKSKPFNRQRSVPVEEYDRLRLKYRNQKKSNRQLQNAVLKWKGIALGHGIKVVESADGNGATIHCITEKKKAAVAQ